MRLSVSSHSGLERVWESLPFENSGRHFIADESGRCEPMEKVSEDVYRCIMTVREDDNQMFQIRIDQDPAQAIYPELHGAAYSGLSSALGPDNMGQETFWYIAAEDGSKVEITLDYSQADPRHRV